MSARHVMLISCILVAVPASAQRDTLAQEQCFKVASHAEARACLEAQSKQSDLALKKAESSLRSALAQWDQETQYKSRSTAQVERAAATFQRYRESQCEFQASLAAGGNGSGDRRLLCHIELNRRRVAELQAAQASLQ
jgi:uncharacterized protein YecT (DUF1311 family)